ncbi:hypothetical protein [Phaeobacter italicus]|uniref:hypothetical protein n=1 Tax=Phaeobacter italicus TaxID=481446 RepID=UPI001C97A92E|nr:hypothetical protein [Phaeobacter italicus]MBY6045280.1 hypothetical protein [Phaeobacter italicus]
MVRFLVLPMSDSHRVREQVVMERAEMFQSVCFRRVSLIAFVAIGASACTDPYYSRELEEIGARPDLSAVSSVDLCDAASYFTYDAPSGEREKAKRLLVEVFNRGDISRKDYNSALTGDVEIGMTDLAATCAWGLPDEEEEYFISGGRKYTRWTYRYGEYGLDRDTVEFINDRVVALRTGG